MPYAQTWLDEHLFGWTRSARRGTSAWAGGQSTDASSAPTPEGSDDEDAGDYEHVLGIVRADGLASPTARSRQGSYADLQRLRGSGGGGAQLKPLTAYASAVEQGGEGGIEHRRTRRESLTDGVSLRRLSALERNEAFNECTKDLNDEIARRKSEG
jgi:glycerol-3-phosphate O-acyltransferase/dihydroxyacetone phosphate acyltransferase